MARAGELAGWAIPRELAVVALAAETPGALSGRLDADVLVGADGDGGWLIVPDPDGPGRRAAIDRALEEEPAAVGLTVAPAHARRSLHRARLALALAGETGSPVRTDEQTRGWVDPCLTDAGVRRDVSRFARAADPAELDAVSGRLGAFPGPALLVWGMADRFFKPAFAHRLRDAFANARLVEIEGGRTFVPHDHPDLLAREIVAFAGQSSGSASVSASTSA